MAVQNPPIARQIFNRLIAVAETLEKLEPASPEGPWFMLDSTLEPGPASQNSFEGRGQKLTLYYLNSREVTAFNAGEQVTALSLFLSDNPSMEITAGLLYDKRIEDFLESDALDSILEYTPENYAAIVRRWAAAVSGNDKILQLAL